MIVCRVKAFEHEAVHIGFDPFIEWARQRIVVFGFLKIASIDIVLEAGNGNNHGVDRFIDILGVTCLPGWRLELDLTAKPILFHPKNM